MVITGDNTKQVDAFISRLAQHFSIKDLGHLHHFLGIEVHKFGRDMFLSQHRYALELLKRANMDESKPISTPMPTKGRLKSAAEAPFHDPSLYRSLVGGLQYLTFTRPNLSYSVNYACQFMQSPTIAHFQLVKRILRYIQGTAHYGMRIITSNTLDLYAFSDTDWTGYPQTRRSTSGFCTFLGSNCVSWSAKKQATVARSSMESEYRSMAATAAELAWLSFLSRDLDIPLHKTPALHCDNLSALHLTINPILHGRTKHVELDYHYIRERVALGSLETRFVTSPNQLADIFTKPLPKPLFQAFRIKLGLCPDPRPMLGNGILDPNLDGLIYTS
ncbi:hypothetical protein F0562_025129 [Nyssa sinensis]|uniref:Reverse transcriptase Ty1/copia-type domain-containing protein n=1 Tax=Nyssa sinensis TaxID=561372 RepID=A0A5J5BD66_9ASTE|nr:hypothetical protein F0562_025129 [Nyssa sinensis]